MSGLDAELLTRVVALRAAWRLHERWSPARIAAHQAEGFERLRAHAVERSPYYRRRYAGLEHAPLSELPPITKGELMEHFDEAVTAPSLRLADLEAHLRDLVEHDGDPSVPWRGRWWVAASAGTTGRRGVFVWDHREYASVIASYTRIPSWAGLQGLIRRPARVATVTSRRPTHPSAVLSATFNSMLFPTLRLDAAEPVSQTASQLNAFRPDLLIGYPSILWPLAAEQLGGRLRITPRSVICASEILSAPAARDMEAAWGTPPLDIYGTTETAGLASMCLARRRHVYEDLVIIEPVDNDYRPVPHGTTAERLLVTVLFTRTLPLIRYEMSDQVRLDGRDCACGRQFLLLTSVEGRAEEALRLPGTAGTAIVHPNVFHAALDDAPVTGWQVVQRQDGLDVLLAGLPLGADLRALRERVMRGLASVGAVGTPVTIIPVQEIQRTALGKAPLVKALRDQNLRD